MVKKLPPVIYCSLAAALVYYGANFFSARLILALFAIPALALTVMAVLQAAVRLFSFSRRFAAARLPAVMRRITQGSRYSFCLSTRPALAFALLGCVLGLASRAMMPAKPALGLPAGSVTAISGTLLDDPRTRPSRAALDGAGMATLRLDRVYGHKGLRVSGRGTVRVYFSGEAMIRLKEFGRKSGVYVEGNFLEQNAQGNGGNSRLLFMAKGTHITSPAPRIEMLRSSIRLSLISRLGPKKWGSLAAALLLGIRDSLDTGLSTAYRDAGLSHILALSGMHLGIISALIAFILKKPLGLRPAALLGAVIISLYVYLVGPQPSLVRSLIMYYFGTAAALGGLSEIRRWPLSVLGAAFVIQILADPPGGEEISFMLSYAALLGILVLSGPILDIFRRWLPPVMLNPLAASIGAFTASMPVTAAFFGVLRPIGIAAGLLIGPLTTVFMILSLAWFAISGIFPQAAVIAEAPLSILYTLMETIVKQSAAFPGLALNGLQGIIAAAAFTAIILFLRFYLAERRNRFAPFP